MTSIRRGFNAVIPNWWPVDSSQVVLGVKEFREGYGSSQYRYSRLEGCKGSVNNNNK